MEAMDTSPQDGASVPPAPTPQGPGSDADAADIEKNKDLAAFSYLWVMSVVVYFLRKDSPFVRFHSKQAILLFLLSLPLWFIPYIGRVLELIILCGAVLGFLAAAQGQRRDVPIVGPFSRGEITLRQAWKQIVESIAHLVAVFKQLSQHAHPAEPAKASASAAPFPSKAPVTPKPAAGMAAAVAPAPSATPHADLIASLAAKPPAAVEQPPAPTIPATPTTHTPPRPAAPAA